VSKKVLAISGAAALALLAVWYLFVFSGQSSNLKKTNSQVSSARNAAASLRQQISVLQQEKVGLPAAQSKLTAIEQALPSSPSLDKLIDDINAAADQSGVDWRAINPTKPATYVVAAATPNGLPGGMQAVTVTLQAIGSYQQVLNFITNLNTMSRLVDVDSVSLNSVDAATPTTAQISTQIFFVPGPATTTAGTATP
jgi:Tfp pilus assembly protein PilO